MAMVDVDNSRLKADLWLQPDKKDDWSEGRQLLGNCSTFIR